MALKLKFHTDAGDCTKLEITDVSGIYSAVNPINLTGYGLPNITIANVDTATIKITTAATAVPYELNAFPTLPNTSGAIFTVLPTDIGYTTSIPDQALLIVYTITGIDNSGTPFTYSVGCYTPVTCDVSCCVDQLIADAASEVACSCTSICDCSCSNQSKSFKAIQANMLLTGYKNLVNNRQIAKSKVVLSLLQQICNCK
jgi:hypothetical protein